MTPSTALIIGTIALLVALLFRRRQKFSRSDRICGLFGLDPEEYQLVASDLGGGKDKIFIRNDGVVGVPDAIFRSLTDDSIIVGEAKSRRYRGSVSDYERYQVTLYLGASRRRFRNVSQGLIRYGCGTCVPIPFQEEAYWRLINLIPDYRRVARKIGRARS